MYRICVCIVGTILTLFLLQPASAGMKGRANNSFTVQDSPLDVAVSMDGNWIYVLTEGGKVKVFSPDGTLNDEIPVDPSMDSIDVTGLAVARIDDKIVLSSRTTGKIQEILVDFVQEISIKGSPFKGPADAPVVLALFTDFQCPYCARMGAFIDQLLTNNPDTLKVVIKNFPLSKHKFAEKAAMASLAAANQDKYWEFHDKLFENARELSDKKIEEIAKELHLDMDRFKADMNSQTIRQKLAHDKQEALKAGVRGTPVMFVNGIMVRERSIPGIQKMIDEELSKTKTK